MAHNVSLSAGTQLSMLYARGSVFACTGRFARCPDREYTTAAARSEQLQDLIVRPTVTSSSPACAKWTPTSSARWRRRARPTTPTSRPEAAERDRRLQALEIANRLAEERERSQELATSQSQLEHDVDQARQELGRAERQLEWERSRRALVEMRSTCSAGIEGVTGLPDLPAMSGRINEMLDSCEQLAVVVITVDDDRVIAPLPDVRRRLVQEIAARTFAFLHAYPGSFAGSLGSEDVVAVIPVQEDPEAFHRSLIALHHALSEPMDLIDVRAVASVQFGVAIAPGHGIRPNALLSRARLAAQAARSNRPSGPVVAYFEESVEARQMMRTFVRERLASAIEAGDVDVHFQPVVDMATGEVTSAEALVRWTDVERGPISPGLFIPLAEETELIVELGGFVLRRACLDAVSWPVGRSGLPLLVSVNVSAAQLVGGVLVEQVDEALALSGLPAHRLAVELTETTLARSDQASSTLSRLRERGVKVEIDDFGTGYSSFSYLTNFPVDAVKIDKSFVDRIASNVDDAAITQAIIQMAHSLRLTVIAEGIEMPGQVEVLRQQGCDALQGYLFAKPMSTADLATWLRRPVPAVEHASALA